jgi:1,4-dihydroxy-2-naphthoyl-CoA hydrolase
MPTLEQMNARLPGTLPGYLGIEILMIDGGHVDARLPIRPELLAPNGFLHAATVVALADTACGFGAAANLPDGARGFTTIELKTNFLGTAREGILTCEATLMHGGRTTHVWDARVLNPEGEVMALFRCTQMILYPRPT